MLVDSGAVNLKNARADPREPKIEKWLRSIAPRQELVIRYAMVSASPRCAAIRSFAARVDGLFALPKLAGGEKHTEAPLRRGFSLRRNKIPVNPR